MLIFVLFYHLVIFLFELLYHYFFLYIQHLYLVTHLAGLWWLSVHPISLGITSAFVCTDGSWLSYLSYNLYIMVIFFYFYAFRSRSRYNTRYRISFSAARFASAIYCSSTTCFCSVCILLFRSQTLSASSSTPVSFFAFLGPICI